MSNGDVKNAAVGQLQATAGAQFGKSQRLLIVVGRDRDSGGTDVVTHRSALSYPDAADQHLRQRDHVHEHLPGRAGQEHIGGCTMMWIGGIQMSDQNTGVHRDHAGQSALSSLR